MDDRPTLLTDALVEKGQWSGQEEWVKHSRRLERDRARLKDALQFVNGAIVAKLSWLNSDNQRQKWLSPRLEEALELARAALASLEEK